MQSIVRDRAITLPILLGPLKGSWWAPGSGGKLGRLYLGTYEDDQTPLFCRHVSKGDTVLDLGANVGYYTLLASRLVGPTGRVIACEPEPLNAAYLRRHVRKNRLTNATVLQTAIGAESGSVRFTRGLGRSRGHINAGGELSVPVDTLDRIVAAHDVVPNVMKIDVEGAEFDLLEGGMATLRDYKPVIFLSTHGRDVHASCCSLLTEIGYRLTVIDDQPLPEARKLFARA
ncbi:MAG: FkbM family methyltransferase [Longimicrobiales bacterium]